ncbi:MAG TPA: hypothetical protein VJH75_01630 [Patescibacteria group bacterium]|nr:hypothetical protein [Patescibacteria group bacterium]
MTSIENRSAENKPGAEVIDFSAQKAEREKKQAEQKLAQEKKQAIEFIKNPDGTFSVDLKGQILDADIVDRGTVEKIFTLVKDPALETEDERREGLVNEVKAASNDEELEAAKEKAQEVVRVTAERIKGYMDLYNLFMEMCDGFDTVGADNVTRMLVLKPGAEKHLQSWYPTEFKRYELNNYNNRPDRGLDYYFVVSPANLDKFYNTFKHCRGEESAIKTAWGFRGEINGIQMAFMPSPEKIEKTAAANDSQLEPKERFAA